MELQQRLQLTDSRRLGEEKAMNIHPSTKDRFEKALQKVKSDDAATSNTGSRADASRKKRSYILPSHITEGTKEASRWRQEFVFYRDETSVKVDSELDQYVTSKIKKVEMLTSKSTTGVTNAHILAAKGDIVRLKDIATKNPQSLNEADSNGWRPIHEAARGGNTETVEFLLRPEFGVDLNARTNKGEGGTPLWWAERELPADHPVIALLRERGAVAIAPEIV